MQNKKKGISQNKLEQLIELWEEVYSPGEDLTPVEIKTRLKKIIHSVPEYFKIPVVINCNQSCREEIKENFETLQRYYGENFDFAGHSDTIHHIKIKGVRVTKGTDQLIDEIVKLFTPEGTQSYKMYDLTTNTGVIPRLNRNSIIRFIRDEYPVFYENEEIMLTRSFKSAAIYIDLSGSMEDFYEEIYYLLRKLSNFISPPYYSFSDKVIPLNLSQLHNLEALTTYGTSFDSVIEDAKRKHIRNLVTLTDGFWTLKENNLKWANSNLNTLLIIPTRDRDKRHVIKKIRNSNLKCKIVLWKV